MNLIKIKNGKIEVVNERGVLQRSFGSNVMNACFNDKQNLIVATYISGRVETLNERGHLQKPIVNLGAVEARWMGDDIAVTTKQGKTEIRSLTGALKRTI